MIDDRKPINLPAGFYRNGTDFQAVGRWADGNLVRFLDGTIRPIGGWTRMLDASLAFMSPVTGLPRAAYALRNSSDQLRLVIGTHTHAFNVTDGVLSDITPSGMAAGQASGTTVIGSTPTVYGAGDYGAGVYGGGASTSTEFVPPDTWSFDGWGDWIIAVFTGDGTLWYSDGPTNDLTPVVGGTYDNPLYDPALAPEDPGYEPPTLDHVVPGDNRAVVVTPERFCVLLGASGNGRLVKWSDQEDITAWTALTTNQAGDFILSTEGNLVCGRRTRRATLLFTTTDLWTMTYIGGTLVYSFDKVGDNCGIIGPNAVTTVGSRAFWMSRNNFWVFDGWAQPIPSDVRDYVFSDINLTNAAKIQCVSNADFDEVWWFYPSFESLENDRYVVYNYRENHWVTGELARSAGVDRGATTYPVWVDEDGYIFEHEIPGFSYRDGVRPFIESGPIPIETGDRVYRVQKLIPDERTVGSVWLTITPYFEPMKAPGTARTYTWTNEERDVRITGRYLKFKFTEDDPADWRIGNMQIGVRATGRR